MVRFAAPVQTGYGAHLSSYTMGTGPLPGVKRQRRGVNQPPESKEEESYTPTLLLGLHGR